MTVLALMTLGSGLLLFLLCLPLIRRKIPRNHFYGVRTKASFESEQRWYDINAYAGRKMAAWSWLITFTGAAGLFVPNQHLLIYAWSTLVVSMIAISVPVAQTIRWSRR